MPRTWADTREIRQDIKSETGAQPEVKRRETARRSRPMTFIILETLVSVTRSPTAARLACALKTSEMLV